MPNDPTFPHGIARHTFDDEEIRAAKIPVADMLQIVVDEHVAAGEEIVSIPPEILHRVDQYIHGAAVPVRFQGNPIVVREVVLGR